MPKYLIIFGAGASHGSDSFNTPPLGNKLFSALRSFNPNGWGTIPNELATSFETDFELAMTQVNPHHLPILQRAMSAYFFRFGPTQSNLYYQLAKKINSKNKWDGALVSLNYERLLELSLCAAGFQPYFGSPPNHQRPIELCLPHGACHIFCEGARGSASGVSFSGTGVTIDGPIRVISNPTEFGERVRNDAFPPVMSYFEAQKRTTSGVSFINGQRSRYADLVNSAEKIAIIGLQVREYDNHLWGPLSITNAKIIYCSGKSAIAGFENWSTKNRVGKDDIILPMYFRDGFGAILEELSIGK